MSKAMPNQFNIFKAEHASSTSPETAPKSKTAARADYFPFNEELKHLEASLSLNLDEGLAFYPQQKDKPLNKQMQGYEPKADIAWNELAQYLASQVVEAIEENRGASDKSAAVSPSESITAQLVQARQENEQLQAALKQTQQELTRFQKLAGKLYIKR